MLRKCTTSFTTSCLVHDEKQDTLRDALTQLIVRLHPLDGPRAIIRVDPSPGFPSMANKNSLNHLNVTIDVGRAKNKNKNPVAENAVREREEELNRQEPGGRPVSAVGLALATAGLNSRLRLPGLSSRELWTQRNQFTHEQLPLSDYDLKLSKHEQRSSNHASSEKSKSRRGLVPTRLHYTLATLCTSFPIRTSLARVIAISWFPLTSLGVSLRSLVVHN